MSGRVAPGTRRAGLHVLVRAVTAAERQQPMPRTVDLAAEIGCTPQNITMALARLERAGVLKNVAPRGRRRRLLVVSTGAITGEVQA